VKLVSTTLCLATLVATAPAALAVTLDSTGIASKTPPQVTCTLGEGDTKVTSFANILGYQFTGRCSVSFPGSGVPPSPLAPYSGGGSWNATNGMVNEYLKGKDAQGHAWEVQGGGTCKLNPWMTGVAGASCSGAIANATPNAPSNILKSLKVPISAELLDGTARASLTGKTLRAMKAEHQAPVIVKPTEGQHAPFPLALQIDPGPESPTKTFALEWQAKVNGAWTSKSVTDQVAFTASLASGKFLNIPDWRVRARAHQAANATWSGWRTFVLPYLPPPPSPVCNNSAAYGASYDVSATPATMAAGATTTAAIKVTNGSNQAWGAGSNYHLSYHWYQNGQVVIADGERTFLPSNVAPCQTVTLSATVKAPPAAGSYQIRWDMVLEGTSWFSNQGVPTANKDVAVAAQAQAPPQPAKK
jgi:hypothetical protein